MPRDDLIDAPAGVVTIGRKHFRWVSWAANRTGRRRPFMLIPEQVIEPDVRQ